MNSKEFFNIINEFAEENDLTSKQIKDAFTKALIYGCRKAHHVKSCRVDIKEDRNEINLYKQYYIIDSEEKDLNNYKDYTHIDLEEAKKFKKRVKVGQIINIKINPKDFNLYAVKDFKNKFKEELTKQKRENIYDYFKSYEGKLINAKVIGSNSKFYYLELEKEMTTLLPKKETLNKEIFIEGDRIQVYIVEVQKTTKLPKIFVSQTHIGLVTKIFEDWIPEINDGTLKIMMIARIPGERTKIGLFSNDPQVDPIGSCIGKNGNRIKSIIKLLQGEKIDLFLWSEKNEELISNSLQPAKIFQVNIVDLENKVALAIVEDDQLSLAIGKLGKNVKLAVQATKWNIDIKTLSQFKKIKTIN
ncbi:MAG: transcription termination factor NusA [Candidatus Phytoplasma pyri]|uniref:transcription termination factor NusA n=1 Tax=Candidatus Phytoplasma pyri TaxID=47566 RepID=UPI0039832E52